MPNQEIATLAGGCFWCLEAVFDDVEGVVSVESGYAGGQLENPTYEQVCTGMTGHAEAVQVTFNADQISYRDLLEIFFTIHDPTTLNRQGYDTGTQYRSAIFYHSPEQKQIAIETIRHLETEDIWGAPIVTQLEPATKFWVAETYHQEYYSRNPNKPYCAAVVAPKVKKFREKFAARRKSVKK